MELNASAAVTEESSESKTHTSLSKKINTNSGWVPVPWLGWSSLPPAGCSINFSLTYISHPEEAGRPLSGEQRTQGGKGEVLSGRGGSVLGGWGVGGGRSAPGTAPFCPSPSLFSPPPEELGKPLKFTGTHPPTPGSAGIQK